MSMEFEEMAEKTLASGETLTIACSITSGKYIYDVDCWDKDGNNRWNRLFKDKAEAQAEYDRWN